jgi:hypothetical protein
MSSEVVKPYLIEEASLTTSGNVVIEATEGFLVGLPVVPGVPATNLLYSAINAGGLPVLFESHPAIPGLAVVQYTPKPHSTSTSQVIVVVRYVNMNPQVSMQGGCALAAVETDWAYDASNAKKPVIVSNYNSGLGITSEATGLVTATSKSIALCPLSVFVANRVIADEAYGGINPVQVQRDYQGTINNASVTIRGVEFPAGSLICENFGFNNDGLWGVAWHISVEMRYNPEGHNPEDVLLDTDTGLPAKNLTNDANYNAANPLARCAADPSSTQSGRKIVKKQRAVNWAPLVALFG